MRKRRKVTVIYKNGTKVHLRCKEFSVTKYTNGKLETKWTDCWPKPLLFGIDEIAAIYEGWVDASFFY